MANLSNIALFLTLVALRAPAETNCGDLAYELQPGVCQWTEQALQQIEEAKAHARRQADGDPRLIAAIENYAFSLWGLVTKEITAPGLESFQGQSKLTRYCAVLFQSDSKTKEEVDKQFAEVTASILNDRDRSLAYIKALKQMRPLRSPEYSPSDCDQFSVRHQE